MDMKCACGGVYRRVKMERYDFSGFAGLPVEVRDVPILRCNKCGEEEIEGVVISAVLLALTQTILGLPRILSPDEAKFLRKRLQLSQKDLAERMGVIRETVAAWECGQKPLSPQNDYILRGLHFGAHLPTGTRPFPEDIREQALGRVHARAKTSAPPEPFVIAAELDRLRETAVHA
jgi:DNA-binding transcriptional regulator YiaG